MKVLSTYRVLKSKALNENVDESWIDWAIAMMEAGYESDNLYMLAGETKPYNQFQLQVLTTKVFQDLGLDYSDRDLVILNYAYYLVSVSVNHPETYYRTLRELCRICQDLDLDSRYMDFYLLYYAKDDLLVGENQYYWDGANRQNIDQIITKYFSNWLNNYERGHRTTA